MGPFPMGRAESPARGASSDQPPATRWRFHPQQFISLGLLSAVLLLVACAPDAKQSTFGTAGFVAEKQALLFNVLLWVMVVVFVLIEGALLYSLIRFRRRPGDPLPSQVHGHTALEITWTVIPTILILGLGIWSVLTLFELEPPPASADTLEVTVTGHQWWWEFEYQDADGSGKLINTANELRVPVGRDVNLLLNSDDVIHSFWIPKLAGKVDVVPTRNNRMWFRGDEIGTFYGQCAEFCGTAHALMKFRVQVLSKEVYMAWVESYGQPPQLSADAKNGQQVFNGPGQCTLCHTVNGTDDSSLTSVRMEVWLDEGYMFPGPNLSDLATRTTIAAGLLDLNHENLRTWLNNPDDVKPGTRMAELARVYNQKNPDGSLKKNPDGSLQRNADGGTDLSPQEVTVLIEYLLSLK